MKVAICLSGHLRTYDKCVSSLMSYFVYPFKADIFCHTWNSIGNPYSTKGNIDGAFTRPLTHAEKNNFISLYKPKKFIIDDKPYSPLPQDDKDFLNQFSGPMFDMFYGVKMANELKCLYEKENNFKYDLVIRCRYDLKFKKSLDVKNMIINHNNIYIPNFGNWHDGANDQFAIGSSYAIDVYSTYYDNVVNLFSYLNRSTSVEEALLFHLQNNNINIIKANIDYDILRLNNRIQWQPRG